MYKRMLTLALALGLPALVGCFDVEQAMTLQKDLSGKAAFSMTVNMEPMMLFMLQMQREMAGKKGAPTAAELEAAKKEFLASRTASKEDPEAQKEEVKKSLPPGVKLLESSIKEEGLKVAVRFVFGFDHISKLSQIQLQKKGEDAAQPGPKNPFDEPFTGLQVKDEGSTLLLTTEAINPAAEQKEQTADMGLTPEMQKQMEDAFKDLRVAYKIEAPFEVVEHNATRKEGKTLIWEYNLKSLEKMTPEQLAQGVRVRFKK
ncbi:MAG TPA: hypothetical protein VGX68_14485 [Thermoanaerobaculia bacterium]|jgi:cell pole-organizing protein PopZ|nr:hypothetical protein [Thermoanaerobaculia bacterium]